MARKAATSAGATTAIIRSCDSLIRISSGASVESRGGTVSSSTGMPPPPAAGGPRVGPDVHAAGAGGRELGGRAGQAGTAEVLDAADQPRREQLEGALDE